MLEGLRGNVCFLHNRGGGLTPQFVLHCDWCGLINGVCETALQNARAVAEARGPAAADAALASGAGGLAVANRYLGFALSMRSEAWAAAVSDEEVEAFCDATFGCGSGSGSAGAGVGVGVGDSQPQGRSNLLALSRLHILGTMVELVWCPFKRCRDDHYRSDDFRYQRVPSEGAERDHYADMGRLLAEGPPTDCAQCAGVVNGGGLDAHHATATSTATSTTAGGADAGDMSDSNGLSLCQPLLEMLSERELGLE